MDYRVMIRATLLPTDWPLYAIPLIGKKAFNSTFRDTRHKFKK
jgi:hypothetical protein